VLSILNLLTIDLSLLLSLLDNLVLILHLWSLLSYMNHRINIGDFHRERLLQLHCSGRGMIALFLIFVICGLEHFIASESFNLLLLMLQRVKFSMLIVTGTILFSVINESIII
jgi:hypothetical protein